MSSRASGTPYGSVFSRFCVLWKNLVDVLPALGLLWATPAPGFYGLPSPHYNNHALVAVSPFSRGGEDIWVAVQAGGRHFEDFSTEKSSFLTTFLRKVLIFITFRRKVVILASFLPKSRHFDDFSAEKLLFFLLLHGKSSF